MNIGDKIKIIRNDNNMSQKAFAKSLGVSRQTISKWENNKVFPDLYNLLTICEKFNINLIYFNVILEKTNFTKK